MCSYIPEVWPVPHGGMDTGQRGSDDTGTGGPAQPIL